MQACTTTAQDTEYVYGYRGQRELDTTQYGFVKMALVYGIRTIIRPGERIRYSLEDIMKLKERLRQPA